MEAKNTHSSSEGRVRLLMDKQYVLIHFLSSSYVSCNLDPGNTKTASLDLYIHIAHGLVKYVQTMLKEKF